MLMLLLYMSDSQTKHCELWLATLSVTSLSSQCSVRSIRVRNDILFWFKSTDTWKSEQCFKRIIFRFFWKIEIFCFIETMSGKPLTQWLAPWRSALPFTQCVIIYAVRHHLRSVSPFCVVRRPFTQCVAFCNLDILEDKYVSLLLCCQ